MAVLDLLWKQKPQSAPDQKASATGRVMAYHSAGRIAWSARDTVSLTKTGFCGNPVGYRVVKLIAEAAAAVPLMLTDGETRFSSHPILARLSDPNPAQTQGDFLEALYGQLMLSGNAYIEAVGTDADELHILRSDRMSLVPGRDGWPVAYEYTVDGRKHLFDMTSAKPICHIRNFHPRDDHYGFSPMQAAAQALDVHNAASSWSKALLDNAARPSGAIVHSGQEGNGGLSQEQFERLQFELESYHQGARNAGRPMLLEGGLDWKPMGFSPSDMEFQKTKEAAAREIATAFGVPPMILGIPGDATYANYAEANRAFYRLTILPLVRRVAAHLAQWMSEDRQLELLPDMDQIPALAIERDAYWSRVANADFLSAAEKRRLLGLPAEEARDEG